MKRFNAPISDYYQFKANEDRKRREREKKSESDKQHKEVVTK